MKSQYNLLYNLNLSAREAVYIKATKLQAPLGAIYDFEYFKNYSIPQTKDRFCAFSNNSEPEQLPYRIILAIEQT
jgi:hypothetical protein